jgi:adenylylsulfate kinase
MSHFRTRGSASASPAEKNIFSAAAGVDRAKREKQNGHRARIIWLTGLSASGKTTIARALEQRLFKMGCHTAVLDGDNLRHGLCADLGFSREDRQENIRRVGEVARLFLDTGTIAISAFISPYAADRDNIRKHVEDGDFIEVYVKCSLAECERRDPKGLYRKARAGLITGFTGLDDPFEPPAAPELVLDTEALIVNEAVKIILEYLHDTGELSGKIDSNCDSAVLTTEAL